MEKNVECFTSEMFKEHNTIVFDLFYWEAKISRTVNVQKKGLHQKDCKLLREISVIISSSSICLKC